MSLTGACGIMLKSYLMASFCGEDASDFLLPHIWCMPCTSAANCGVSSKRCDKCFRYGPCPNWHDLVQEIGRVNRQQTASHGEHSYWMYPNVPSYLSMWIHVQTQSNNAVRMRHLTQLNDVLRFMVLPTRCYHKVLEEHFENPEDLRVSWRMWRPLFILRQVIP